MHKMIFASDKGCDDDVKEKQIRPLQVKYADFESFKKLSTEVINDTCL